jgi:hypothetical protein
MEDLARDFIRMDHLAPEQFLMEPFIYWMKIR